MNVQHLVQGLPPEAAAFFVWLHRQGNPQSVPPTLAAMIEGLTAYVANLTQDNHLKSQKLAMVKQAMTMSQVVVIDVMAETGNK